MIKKANPLIVGAFVLGALILAVTGLLLFSGGHFFDDTFHCVMFFDESISGLDSGAPVEFQGVRVGTVADVRLEIRAGERYTVSRPVLVRLEGKRVKFDDDGNDDITIEEFMEQMVRESDMRAQLAMQSLLTGKLKIEMGFFPDTPATRHGLHPEYWEFPTVPSPLQRFSHEVAQMPLYAIVSETHNAVKGIADIVTSSDTRQVISNLNNTLDKTHLILAHVEAEIKPLLAEIGYTAQTLRLATDEDSPLRQEVLRMLDEFASAGRSLRLLTDYLERHPDALWRGKK
ncbi:MAG: MlaD family protein [Kiritimatiellia bacterium]|nr:MlaD family protein [Lentisphaerota bacterium]